MTVVPLASDDNATLQKYALGFEHPSLHRRLAALGALVDWLCPAGQLSESEPFSKPDTRFLVRHLLSAICNPQYLERLWIKGLHDALASATTSGRCSMFTPICVINLSGE